MDEDWALDVLKYVPDADRTAIAGIVRYCGIALRNRDSSLVSFTDPAETDRVRENYLKKKLGLVEPDSVLDTAIAKVGEIMKGDSTRNRVTVYYLLAQAFGKLDLFGGSAATAATLPLGDGDRIAAAPIAAAPVAAAAAAAAPVYGLSAEQAAAIAPVRGAPFPAWAWLIPLLMAAVALAWCSMKPATPVVTAPAVPEVAPVAAPAVPEVVPDGAGITTTVVEGRPQVSVYFDTAKYDIYPNFEARTEEVRKYLADNPGNHLQVSGFNDPRGNAAFNAQLSKNRAFAVRDALVKLGVPATDIDLVKPADTTDDVDSLARARRVDITIKDGPVVPGAVEAATTP